MAIKNKNIITIILGITLTGACFFALNHVNQRLTHPNGVDNVVIAIKDLEKGSVIDKNTINTHFKIQKNVDKSVVPNNSIKNLQKLDGVILQQDITKNEIVSNKDFIKLGDTLSKIQTPREVSIDVKNIGDGVGGLLRQGDKIDISLRDKELIQTVPVLKNVYINKALTSNGAELKREDKNSASIINVILDAKDVLVLESAKQKGEITISKIK